MRETNNPTYLKINKNIYAINTDFRAWIKYSNLCLDDSVLFEYRVKYLLMLAFGEEIKEDLQKTFESTLFFLTCGQMLDVQEKTNESTKENEIYFDYLIDHSRIKAGFYRLFGFNPWALDYFHWWDFKACLDDLLGATLENKIQIRQIDLADYKGKSRTKMKKLKDMHKIKSKESIKNEIEDKNFNNLMMNGSEAEILAYYKGENNNG